ncbi:MAG: ACT domain-containing protein, partial [Caulobacterales bacterium]|nr:ACT domain-containing protein [Caulobacterales bacterium]
YWLGFEPASRRRQLDFALSLMRDRARIAATAGWLPEVGAAEIVVYAPDEPGLFARLARAVTQVGGDVRSARAHPTRDGGVFDVFVVETPGDGPASEAQLDRLKAAVLAAARGDAAPAAIKRRRVQRARAAAFDVEPAVVFDDAAGGDSTVIEVSGRDRPGLLADLADALAAEQLDVRSAHVDSIGAQALDVFYATDRAGRRVSSPGKQDEVRRRLLAALAAVPARRADARP